MWQEGSFCNTAYAMAVPESLPQVPSRPPEFSENTRVVLLVDRFTSSALGSNQSLRTGSLLPLSMVLAVWSQKLGLVKRFRRSEERATAPLTPASRTSLLQVLNPVYIPYLWGLLEPESVTWYQLPTIPHNRPMLRKLTEETDILQIQCI